jgi:microcystin-dependent protein
MKKFSLIFISFIALVTNVKAQSVGIGTTNPNEKLQIDSGNLRIGNAIWTSPGNNTFLKFGDGDFVTLGERDYDDALVFNANYFLFKSITGAGNVGIGTTGLPTAKLEVNNSFKYTDGNEAVGKVLTSDATGNASWQTSTVTPTLSFKICMARSGLYPSFTSSGSTADETYLGEIKIFPYSQVPAGWIECKGQLLPIAQNAALFTLIGTTYGGNGVTDFAVPNLTFKSIIGQ